MKAEAILLERNKTHGSFQSNAAISQHLKSVMMTAGYRQLKPEHAEALDMICAKISRILSGQANYYDHWQDISGYSLLAMKACDIQKD
jgi:hypothetical protein